LLAAGFGTRLRPITETVPKCLVPIHGRPLLSYWLDLLLRDGVERVLVNTHHLSDMVEAFVAGAPWGSRGDLVHEQRLLGTAGTLLQNRAYFGSQPALVAHGDNLSVFDVRKFVAGHANRPRGTVMTMMTFDTDAPETCGIVVLDDKEIVREMHEKARNPPGRRANAAVYIVEQQVLDYIASLGKPVVDFSTEVLPVFMGRIAAFHNSKYHRDIGTPESLRKAEREFSAVSGRAWRRD